MSDLNKLKELASRATAKKWRRASTQFNGITADEKFSFSNEKVIISASEKRDAEFIAAANPATVIDLIDRLEAAEAELARRDEAAGEPVAHIIQDESCFPGMVGHIHVDFTPTCRDVKNNGTVQPLYAAAQPSALPWQVDSCSNCGSKRLSWDTTVIKNTAVQDGLLKLNETSGLFYLGCDECSETLLKVSADDVASHLNNAKALGAQPEKVVDLSKCRTLWYEHDDLSAEVQCIPYSDLKKALEAAGVKWKEAE